jgi:hypothetical protein
MDINRRQFLKRTGMALGAASQVPGGSAQSTQRVSLVADPSDPTASAPPARWAARELQEALATRGVAVSLHERLADAGADHSTVLIAGLRPQARGILKSAGVSALEQAEALGLVSGKVSGKAVLLASGSDVRGLVYALLELADRVRHAEDPIAALETRKPVIERPANRIRSITRCFVSDVEDKPWYNDRSMWPPYLSLLAAQRFNRFTLTLGIGYDFPRNISDCYFHFAYPFLLSVRGYNVRATGLPDAERDRNLEMLRYISDETAARGLQFQLGLWTHAYEWTDSPKANFTIVGLTPENHGAYCRDALLKLLEACPAITGITFRIHGESGVAEGSYDFWKTVFDGIVRCGRRIEIDMHAKGMDDRMIEVALATGMPVTISPKYWAEHMGLPYHQAAIRELEMPRPAEGFFALSSGSRRFLRYGYGDLLREDRRYGILYRIWPGTQRVLLWGDPAMAAGYGRESHFCGSDGVEICEPLSFKGRKGSGLPGGRNAYADGSLTPAGGDWEKYLYSYRVWGRLLYNPDAEPEIWQRFLRKQFKAGASSVEAALANASRVLPLFTTAHGLSGANNTYWPEMYTNMPIVDAARAHPYTDTPSPRRFGTVSPFDPELFARVDDFAEELLKQGRSGKYSPVDVAQWLEDFAQTAAKRLAQADSELGGGGGPEFRRLALDVAIQSGLGRFFAGKLRSGVLWALYERSGDRTALEESLKAYRAARSVWAELAAKTRGVYAPDITFGYVKNLRGHWLDRLPDIDADIADMEKRLEQASVDGSDSRDAEAERVKQAIREALGRPQAVPLACRHKPPAPFRPGQKLDLELQVENGKRPVTVRLHYRRVNQSENYKILQMEEAGNRYRAAITGEYTASPYPVQYFFTLHAGPDAWLYPGFEPNLSNRPYFVVRQVRDSNKIPPGHEATKR